MKIVVAFIFAVLVQTDETIYTVVDSPATPIGGMSAFYKKISPLLKFPARNTCDVWKAYIEFIVEKDGTMSDIKMARDTSPACENIWLEPFRKLAQEKLWNAAQLEGKIVRQRFILPIEVKPG